MIGGRIHAEDHVTARSRLLSLTLVLLALAGCDASGGGGDAASIPECDKLFRVADACFSKNPVVKASMADTVDQVKDMLKPRSGEPLERAKIADVCRQRTAAVEQACR